MQHFLAQLEAPVGAQNDEKWQGCEANSILALRKHFSFNINIHPINLILWLWLTFLEISSLI
ncbi:hypothetical protein A2G94_02290 [Francisella endosymbiont of Ornithodoros moubata]|nr:hypothetical protein A2G94_02290 [Francisella endosymbiont of Ornithodoros moubata]